MSATQGLWHRLRKSFGRGDRAPAADQYARQVEQEIGRYAEVVNVHDLPPIFHYWSNKFLAPMLHEYEIFSVEQFFSKFMVQAALETGQTAPAFISIGAGNCELEIAIVKSLRSAGLGDFTLECLELNPHMVERGKSLAGSEGVAQHLLFTIADFNLWQPTRRYSAVMANHSLHHVVNLEGLFDAISIGLVPRGKFLASDVIGRNGHQRWPEALNVLEKFWHELPQKYRYNHILKRQESEYINMDCSAEGFEGIRAEDILPLLLARFHFELFIGFSNVIQPFIDRCFGHNFDVESAWDRSFIDRVHAADEAAFADGSMKPTQMFAVMTRESAAQPRYSRGISPAMAVRPPG